MRDKRKIRLLFLGSLIVTLIFVYISITWLGPTLSRYVKRERDEIRAYYTSLYFDSTGEGKTIALEEVVLPEGTMNIGYVEFDLRNYIGENVTERDIVYSISKPTVFYYKDGENAVAFTDINSSGTANDEIKTYLDANVNNKLYVLDGWGKLQQVERSTYLYDVSVVSNNGEVVSDGVYSFTYEKLGASAKGKSHTVTCQVLSDVAPGDDTISIVVHLTKPYQEVFIINMRVSDKLITFSQNNNFNMFNVEYDKLYIQTADLFAYLKDDNTVRTTKVGNSTDYYKYTSAAVKLTFYWKGYILDEEELEKIHIGTSSVPKLDKDTIDKHFDKNIMNGDSNNIGSIPNKYVHSPYYDIEQSTIGRFNSVYENNTHRGELVMFVPQGSDVSLLFLRAGTTGTVKVKIEVYVTEYKNNSATTTSYQVYDEEVFGGYSHVLDDGEYLYPLMSYSE